MSWTDDFRARTTTAERAVSLVESGARVFVAGNAATPYVLLRALADRASQLEQVEVTHVLLLGDDPLSREDVRDQVRHNSLFVGPGDREAVNDGRADYIPAHLHQIPRLLTTGRLPIDVALLQTSPPDEHGYLSLGVECLASPAAVGAAKTILVQVNEQMPRALGDCFIHVSQVTRFVPVSEPLPERARRGSSEVEAQIGRFVAERVEDGATLQLGIGGIPDAVLASLQDRKNLGIHTEMVSDGILEAVEAGVVTGSRKTLHRGKIVCTFAFGSERLYRFLHDNPVFEFHPCDYTNDPTVIARNDSMVAINSALEVDLTGQVCSDSIGTRIYSGFGGQLDFIRGAAAAKNGTPIIAMPSTAVSGARSRIVPLLQPGAGVVTTRADVHVVVTEHGVADLFGRNLRERAQALIRIAHPDFREDLERAARRRKLLPQVFTMGDFQASWR